MTDEEKKIIESKKKDIDELLEKIRTESNILFDNNKSAPDMYTHVVTALTMVALKSAKVRTRRSVNSELSELFDRIMKSDRNNGSEC